MNDKPDFASRWSDRKRAVQAEEVVEPQVEDIAEPVDEERTEAEILAELGLKDPDEMKMGDDFSVFMKEKIPAQLKKRALRKLWVSNPTLACVDGLNDYDDDFTNAATSVKNLKTAYEVGKGYATKLLREEEEAAEKAKAEEIASMEVTDSEQFAEEDAETSVQNDELEEIDAAAVSEEDASPDEIAKSEYVVQLEDEPVFQGRKRMNFEF